MADLRDKRHHHHFRFVDEEPEVQRHPRASGVQASTHLLTQPLCHLVEGNVRSSPWWCFCGQWYRISGLFWRLISPFPEESALKTFV